MVLLDLILTTHCLFMIVMVFTLMFKFMMMILLFLEILLLHTIVISKSYLSNCFHMKYLGISNISLVFKWPVTPQLVILFLIALFFLDLLPFLKRLRNNIRSLPAITTDLKWLRALLLDLSNRHSQSIPLYCDRKSALPSIFFVHGVLNTSRLIAILRVMPLQLVFWSSSCLHSWSTCWYFYQASFDWQFSYLLGKLNICDLHASTWRGIK